MTNYIEFLKNRKIIFVIACIVALILLTLVYFLLANSKKQTIIPPSVPTPTPFQLSTIEMNYPEATNLPSFPPNAETGTLVVTSEPQRARVIIDPIEEEVPEEKSAISPAHPRPADLTPFRISKTPVGKHTLTAGKEGYVLASMRFVIKKNEVTRVKITLTPLDAIDSYRTETNFRYGEWIDTLPLKNPYYYVEYDTNTSSIKATLYTYPSFTTPVGTQVEFLQGEVRERLKEIGADLTREEIGWVIR